MSWEGGWDVGRGREWRTTGGGDGQAWPFAALVRGSGHDQTGGLGCEGTTCQERHVKSVSAGMQKSELCKPQTHPLVRVPGGGQALRPGPHAVPGALCLLCGHTLLFSSKKPQSNLPLTLEGTVRSKWQPLSRVLTSECGSKTQKPKGIFLTCQRAQSVGVAGLFPHGG